MKLRWTPEAADDLETISTYLWERSPQKAHETITRISEFAKLLKRFPELGPVSNEMRGHRKLWLTPLPYSVTYRVDAYAVTLLQIRHESQDWLPVLQ